MGWRCRAAGWKLIQEKIYWILLTNNLLQVFQCFPVFPNDYVNCLIVRSKMQKYPRTQWLNAKSGCFPDRENNLRLRRREMYAVYSIRLSYCLELRSWFLYKENKTNVWSYLEFLDRIRRIIGNIIGSDLAGRLQLLSHRNNVASLCLFLLIFSC